jgi:hypothetical protein
MATTQYPPGTGPLLRLLYGLPDRAIGHSLATLPEPCRSEALLIACAHDGLVEFGETRFTGGSSDAEYWHRHDFDHNRPYGPFLQAAIAGCAPVFEGAVTAPGRVRLTGKGEAEVARWMHKSAPAEAEQEVEPEDESEAGQRPPADPRKARRVPWWHEWQYWGVGVDAESRWHLFHFRPTARYPSWSRHVFTGQLFSQVLM